jgi:thioredoxin-related protein
MKAAQGFGIRMIPTQVFLDEEGNYIGNHVGLIEQKELISTLKKLKIL